MAAFVRSVIQRCTTLSANGFSLNSASYRQSIKAVPVVWHPLSQSALPCRSFQSQAAQCTASTPAQPSSDSAAPAVPQPPSDSRSGKLRVAIIVGGAIGAAVWVTYEAFEEEGDEVCRDLVERVAAASPSRPLGLDAIKLYAIVTFFDTGGLLARHGLLNVLRSKLTDPVVYMPALLLYDHMARIAPIEVVTAIAEEHLPVLRSKIDMKSYIVTRLYASLLQTIAQRVPLTIQDQPISIQPINRAGDHASDALDITLQSTPSASQASAAPEPSPAMMTAGMQDELERDLEAMLGCSDPVTVAHAARAIHALIRRDSSGEITHRLLSGAVPALLDRQYHRLDFGMFDLRFFFEKRALEHTREALQAGSSKSEARSSPATVHDASVSSPQSGRSQVPATLPPLPEALGAAIHQSAFALVFLGNLYALFYSFLKIKNQGAPFKSSFTARLAQTALITCLGNLLHDAARVPTPPFDRRHRQRMALLSASFASSCALLVSPIRIPFNALLLHVVYVGSHAKAANDPAAAATARSKTGRSS